jgi:hypothetical protein
MADLDLPPIYAWAFLGGTWFFATALLAEVFKVRLPVFPRFLWVLGILAGLYIFSGISLGVMPFVLLIPWAVIPFILSLFMRRPPFDNRTLRVLLWITGCVALAAILVLAFWSHRIRTTRTRAEFIVQWPHTPPAREFMIELKKEEPESLNQYRYILEHGDSLLASDMAEKIAVIGDPDVDIPLLKKRLEEFQNDPWGDSYAQDFQAAIDKLEKKTGEPQ